MRKSPPSRKTDANAGALPGIQDSFEFVFPRKRESGFLEGSPFLPSIISEPEADFHLITLRLDMIRYEFSDLS